jgi:hypothetical protein
MRTLFAVMSFAVVLTGCGAQAPVVDPVVQSAAAPVETTPVHESNTNSQACEALWDFYTKLDRPSSDAEGGRHLRAIAQRAATEQVKAAIVEDAQLWESGSNEWGPGTEACSAE